MTDEIWKPILGFEGYYEVSNLGRVRSVDRYDRRGYLQKSHLLSPSLKKTGYEEVHLYVNHKQYTFSIHRLVAKAFINNPREVKCVNHIDGNKRNNVVSNLEWCTHGENLRKAYEIGLLKERKVLCVETGVVFYGLKRAAEFAGVTDRMVQMASTNYRGAKTAGGYHFKYVDEVGDEQ